MNHLENIRNLHKRVTDNAFGEEVTVRRADHASASPQGSYSPGSGRASTTLAGSQTLKAMRRPVELIDTPNGMIEAQPWSFTRDDLNFPVAEGDVIIPSSGANAGQELYVVKVGHRIAGSAVVAHTAITHGAAGLDSSGEED